MFSVRIVPVSFVENKKYVSMLPSNGFCVGVRDSMSQADREHLQNTLQHYLVGDFQKISRPGMGVYGKILSDLPFDIIPNVQMSQVEIDKLHEHSINIIRHVPGFGLCVWGQRVRSQYPQFNGLPHFFLYGLYNALTNTYKQLQQYIIPLVYGHLYTELNEQLWNLRCERIIDVHNIDSDWCYVRPFPHAELITFHMSLSGIENMIDQLAHTLFDQIPPAPAWDIASVSELSPGTFFTIQCDQTKEIHSNYDYAMGIIKCQT